MSAGFVKSNVANPIARRKTRLALTKTNANSPNLGQWHWLRHIVRAGKDSVLVKASTWKEKKEIMDSLLAIDRWLESRYSTKFERPMVGDR